MSALPPFLSYLAWFLLTVRDYIWICICIYFGFINRIVNSKNVTVIRSCLSRWWKERIKSMLLCDGDQIPVLEPCLWFFTQRWQEPPHVGAWLHMCFHTNPAILLAHPAVSGHSGMRECWVLCNLYPTPHLSEGEGLHLLSDEQWAAVNTILPHLVTHL